MPRLQIDNLDTKILQMLVDNGRKPFLEIARECGVSGAAIHQRIAKLQATNILEGSRALIKPTTLGYDTCAFIGVFLRDPDKFGEVSKSLLSIPEVVECHYTTGQYDMLLKVYARDNEHLLRLIHEKLQPLGLMRTETLVSFREVFSRALPVSQPKG
ncbi:MAG: Lrp/AsnC ligand binding domain-containing protein [Muribaculaceae bacterium]|nr:Lrp/AsnC ligand binding domain-containing protein [Muribaculaceae bacterium]